MQIRVDLNGWEHQCCGAAYELNEIVTRDLYLPYGATLQAGADFMESHHEHLSGGVSMTGRVIQVEVLNSDGEFEVVTRLPSAAALSGMDDDDDGQVISVATGVAFENEPEEFIVTLKAPDGAPVPTERAQNAV